MNITAQLAIYVDFMPVAAEFTSSSDNSHAKEEI